MVKSGSEYLPAGYCSVPSKGPGRCLRREDSGAVTFVIGTLRCGAGVCVERTLVLGAVVLLLELSGMGQRLRRQ